MRLNRFLALAGIASRRGAEEFIRDGRVRVNGEAHVPISRPKSPRLTTSKSKVALCGAQEFVYLLLNKPPDYSDHPVR